MASRRRLSTRLAVTLFALVLPASAVGDDPDAPGPETANSGEHARASSGTYWLGLQAAPQTDDADGLRIARVVPGSPAERAGLRAGSRIVRAGDQQVETLEQLRAAVDRTDGEQLDLTVGRDGDRRQVSVAPAPRPVSPGALARRLVGTRLPSIDFVAPSLAASSTEELPHEPLVIEFWTTWCPPCRRSAAVLERVGHRWGKDLQLLAITPESRQALERYPMDRSHSPVALAVDADRSALRSFFVETYPTLILVDAEREIRGVYVGLDRLETFRDDLEDLMREH